MKTVHIDKPPYVLSCDCQQVGNIRGACYLIKTLIFTLRALATFKRFVTLGS